MGKLCLIGDIKLVQKCLTEPNTLAYYRKSQIAMKQVLWLWLSELYYKTIYALIYDNIGTAQVKMYTLCVSIGITYAEKKFGDWVQVKNG